MNVAARGLLVLAAVAAVAAAIGWTARPPAARELAPATASDVRIRMDDGAQLAATLYLPAGPRPSGGWPGVVVLHGIAGTRAQVAAVAEALGASGYAALAYDARAHGESGGLFTAGGPREIADLSAVRTWLAGRPETSDAVGAWGVSYGGGQVLRALTDGVPFRAAVVAATWTDLYGALVPGGLAKSGAVFALLNSVPAGRRAPEVNAVALAAIAGRNASALRAFAARRSSLARLRAVRTSVLLLQGRRDFAFSLDQGLAAYRALRGAKHLYIGPFGHAPSSFPGPDAADVLRRSVAWLDLRLKPGPHPAAGRRTVTLAPEPYRAARVTTFAAPPPTRVVRLAAGGSARIRGLGAFTRPLGRTGSVLETFGRPVVTLRAAGSFPHVVAVLEATTPAGRRVVVSAGGAKVRLGRRARTVTVRLAGQATLVPRGSRLTLRVGSTSGDLLYVVPAAPTRTLAVGRIELALPVLRRPVSSP